MDVWTAAVEQTGRRAGPRPPVDVPGYRRRGMHGQLRERKKKKTMKKKRQFMKINQAENCRNPFLGLKPTSCGGIVTEHRAIITPM